MEFRGISGGEAGHHIVVVEIYVCWQAQVYSLEQSLAHAAYSQAAASIP